MIAVNEYKSIVDVIPKEELAGPFMTMTKMIVKVTFLWHLPQM